MSEIFRRVMGIPAGQPLEGMSQTTVARWDSLRHAELLIALQRDFGIRFRAEEARELRSYERVLSLVRDQAKGPSA